MGHIQIAEARVRAVPALSLIHIWFVAWLQHSEKNNKVRIHARESEGYKQIITEVTVIRQAGPFYFSRCAARCV